MSFSHAASYARVLLKRGPIFCVSNFIQTGWFDLIHRTNTHIPMKPEEYAQRPADFDHGIWYVCSRTDEILNALKIVERMSGRHFPDFQFFDLGSGKGKSLLVYCMQVSGRFLHRPVGIEYDPHLSNIAQKNLHKMGFSEIAEIVVDDARRFRAQCTSERLLLFLYNPFDWSVLGEVVALSQDKETILVYIDPRHEAELLGQGFSIAHSKRGRDPNRNVTILHRAPTKRPASMSMPQETP